MNALKDSVVQFCLLAKNKYSDYLINTPPLQKHIEKYMTIDTKKATRVCWSLWEIHHEASSSWDIYLAKQNYAMDLIYFMKITT